MSLRKIEISLEGSSIKIINLNPLKPNAPEYYPVTNIKSIVPIYEEGFGVRQTDGNRKNRYHYDDKFEIRVNLINQDSNPPIRFDIQDIDNQAGWTADLAGLIQAVEDINGWTAIGGGGAASDVNVLNFPTSYPAPAGSSVAHSNVTGAGSVPSGRKAIMFTVLSGTALIGGLSYPVGVYTYEIGGAVMNFSVSYDATGSSINIVEIL